MGMKDMATIPFSMRMDADDKARLKDEAKRADRSESYIANLAIKQYLNACELKRNAIDQAVKEAGGGQFISSERMGAWVDSWGTDTEQNPPEPDVPDRR